MTGHQTVELLGIDLMAGEPELHFDLVVLQPGEREARIAGRQRLVEHLQHPVAEGWNPAGPIAAVATLADGTFDQLGVGGDLGKTFATRPFEQAMEEGAGVRAAREAMDVAALCRHFTHQLGIDPLIVEQLLGLGAVGTQCLFTDPQGAVGGDPPVFGCRTPRLACR
ncbi:hypothetical protein D3C76_1073930 [compost metagenome]